jgi:hypothetical protein
MNKKEELIKEIKNFTEEQFDFLVQLHSIYQKLSDKQRKLFIQLYRQTFE